MTAKKEKKKEIKPEYWMCIIGPADRNKLPAGSDFPIRSSVKKIFEQLTGHNADVCASGWGYDIKQIELIRKISNLSINDPIFQILQKILI